MHSNVRYLLSTLRRRRHKCLAYTFLNTTLSQSAELYKLLWRLKQRLCLSFTVFYLWQSADRPCAILCAPWSPNRWCTCSAGAKNIYTQYTQLFVWLFLFAERGGLKYINGAYCIWISVWKGEKRVFDEVGPWFDSEISPQE